MRTGMRSFAGGVALATVLAALLRFPTLGVQSFWLDEALTAGLMELGFADMLEGVRAGESTPPVYYALLWVWSQVAGTSDVALRALSAVAGTATVPVAAALAATLASRRAGVAAAVLVAVNPWLVWFSQETRAYALYVLVAALTLLLASRVRVHGGRGALAAWAACAVLAVATHWFAAFLVAAEGVWLLTAARRPARVLAATAAVAVAAAVLAPLAASQRQGGPAGIADLDPAMRATDFVKRVLAGEFGSPVDALTVVAGLLLAAGALLAFTRTERGERRWLAALTAVTVAYAALPVAFALGGLDYVLPRYLVPVLVPVCVVAGAGFVARGARRAGLALGTALVLLHAGLSVAAAAEPAMQRDDWEGAAAAIGRTGSDRPVVVTPATTQVLQRYRPALEPLPGTPVAAAEVVVVIMDRFAAQLPAPPAPAGFALASREDAESWSVLRYRAAAPRPLTAEELIALRLEDAVPALLLAPG